MKIIIASQNEGKLKEFRSILGPLGYEVFSANELGYNLDHLEETATTFEGNALIKANALFEMAQLPVIADDSGLCVNALPDILGVYSARYMGYDTPYDIRNQTILDLLEGKDKAASFHSVIAYVDKDTQIGFEGIVEGVIKPSMGGLGGFGYDPIFYPLGFEESFAAMDADQKNAISHRGIALRKCVEYLKAKKL